MKRQIIKILGVLFLIGCNNIDYVPKYKDFENDWERENLIGKVKTLKQLKANVKDFTTGKIDKPTIEFKKEFTKAGKISYQEHFDNLGKLKQFIKNSYDKKGFRIESISENSIMPSKSVEKAVYDTITKNQISAHIIYNDTLIFDAFFKNDKHGNVIEQNNIQNGDTTSGSFEYKYDNHGRILFKTQIDNEKNEYTNEFKYNSEGNLIELINKSDFFGEMTSIYEYESKSRIIKITEYKSGQIEKETSFDKFYNKTLILFYVNNELHKEMKYEYKFDKTGNWIMRDVFMKEYFGDRKTIPIFTETREIEYYK
jgi:hypothetical protein